MHFGGETQRNLEMVHNVAESWSGAFAKRPRVDVCASDPLA